LIVFKTTFKIGNVDVLITALCSRNFKAFPEKIQVLPNNIKCIE